MTKPMDVVLYFQTHHDWPVPSVMRYVAKHNYPSGSSPDFLQLDGLAALMRRGSPSMVLLARV